MGGLSTPGCNYVAGELSKRWRSRAPWKGTTSIRAHTCENWGSREARVTGHGPLFCRKLGKFH